MCGIAGIFDTREPSEIDRALLSRMSARVSHRGPDDEGFHLAPGIGLAHRRLAIIDLSADGHQPLFNEDGSVCVVYNGEIYNYLELLKELASRGHRFRSRCDTEVVVHAWEEWGERCVERFNGMFAFAIWDSRSQTLFLARDRFGEKPLYYGWLEDGHFLFASELKSLLVHPKLRREISPQAVEDYFAYGYVPDPKTIYRDVLKLPPAHRLVVRRGGHPSPPRPYWNVTFQPSPPASEARIAEELIERLKHTVGTRMMADVPLGAFLSGGVDSSSVVAMMASQSPGPVNTCSISFDDVAYDESEYALEVSRLYRTDHFSRQATVGDFDLLDQLAVFYDEPFADSSALPTYLVCSLARERVTVALSGDGGDEIFGGYRRYYWHESEERIRAMCPVALRRPVFSALAAVYPKADWAPRFLRAKSTLQGLARESTEAYFNSVCAITETVRERLFSPAHRQALQGYRAIEVLRRHMDESQAPDSLSRIQYADIKTYLPGDILTKVDRASMAKSLEVRVPLLDHEFVEWVAKLPTSFKLNGQVGKHILKKALRRHLPHHLLYRRKMGFAVPLKAWFRGPLRERARAAITGRRLAESSYFDMPFLRSLLDQHQAGVSDHSSALWSLMMFESFLRLVHEEPPARLNAPKPLALASRA